MGDSGRAYFWEGHNILILRADSGGQSPQFCAYVSPRITPENSKDKKSQQQKQDTEIHPKNKKSQMKRVLLSVRRHCFLRKPRPRMASHGLLSGLRRPSMALEGLCWPQLALDGPN